ncbi:MAG: ABC transporter permease [Rhodospirillales bacterium]|nr:ABC transporter permease [Rhodospirillales bacterium]MBO6786033.1 ABC transporter permease [Rhodospirillales bacterium]
MSEQLTTVDGRPLKAALASAERSKRIRAVLLVMPLFIFIFFSFLYPIALMLYRSVENPLIAQHMPETVAVLEDWDGNEVPGEEAFAALAKDLVVARESREIGKVATRLNFETPGLRSVITGSARSAGKWEPPYKEKFIDRRKEWGELATWATIKRLSPTITSVNYLAAVDRQYSVDGEIQMIGEDYQIYVDLFLRTLWMSVVVTVSCLILGFPIAYMLASLPLRHSNLLMILVLLPFWTSLLVRTTSWIVLLQTQGVLNDIMVWTGIIDDAQRIQLIFNAQGTVIAMTQILLPFMVLPLYSVMKTIPPSYLRAAESLGAHRFLAFWRIYVPNTLPGVGAGCLLVFILAIGYYITPALVGGQDGQMISNMIAFHMQKSLNWGLAAALGGILLVGVIILYWLYNKLVGIDRLKLG